jgi:predicted MFS family arabinose efflux permease
MINLHSLSQTMMMRLAAALESPALRRLWASTLLSSAGWWINRLAIGWLVLELTNSPFWVGLVASLEGAGLVAFGVFAGIVVDRIDRRKALMAAYVASGVLTVLVGLLALAGRIALWHLVAVVLLRGAMLSLQATAYNTVLYGIAGPQGVMNANAFKMLCFNLTRIAGSALAGAIIAAAGVGPSYLIAGLAMCAAALPLSGIPGSSAALAAPQAFWQAARSGIAYVWRSGPLRTLLLLSVTVETFAFTYQSMIPVIARDVLRVGPIGLGWLSAAGGVGAAAGTLLTLWLSDTRRKADWLLVGAGLSGLSLVLFGLSPWYALSLVLVACVGLALMIYDVLMNTLFHLLTSDDVRGRVMSVYTLTYGLNAVGGALSGMVASAAGAPVAVALTGGLVLAYLAPTFGRIRRVRPHDEPRCA